MRKKGQGNFNRQDDASRKKRGPVLFAGVLLCVTGFLCMLPPVLLTFIPGAAAASSVPTVEVSKYMSIAAVALSFVGIMLTVAGANSNKLAARLSFFFGLVGFIVGIVMMILTVFFSALLSIV